MSSLIHKPHIYCAFLITQGWHSSSEWIISFSLLSVVFL